jgi:hypothetical protein
VRDVARAWTPIGRSLLALGMLAEGCGGSPPPVAPAQAWAVEVPPPSAGDTADAAGEVEPRLIPHADVVETPIRPGVGVGPLVVGQSTAAEVEAWLGLDREETRHTDYSIESRYLWAGIATYVCQEDPKERVFVIELTEPFAGETPEGFAIGRTRLGEVVDRLGEGTWNTVGDTPWMSYRGISFHVAGRDGLESAEDYADALLIEIDVELAGSDGGLAQCPDHPTW